MNMLYCECVNDAGAKFHLSLVFAWTEGSSLLLFIYHFLLTLLVLYLFCLSLVSPCDPSVVISIRF